MVVYGCSKEEGYTVSSDNFKIKSYHATYLHYPFTLYVHPNHDNLVKFEYDLNGRIAKRIGDIIHIPSGGSYISSSLYTSLNYDDNKVHLVKATSDNSIDIFQYESIISLDAQNRMSQKIIIKETSSSIEPVKDTTNYTYSDGKLTAYIKTYTDNSHPDFNTRYFKESNLYYTGANLDSIVTLKSMKFSDWTYAILLEKESEIFSGYDNAHNPFRNLQIFEETFRRSLSQNNYTEYKKTRSLYNYPNDDYSQDPTLSPAQEVSFQRWDLIYNSNGEWMYNEF